MSSGSDHVALWAYESAACEPDDWERWIDAVEAILGHSADGDSEADGYSLDEFYENWEQGMAPSSAVAVIRRFVTVDGQLYWLRDLETREFFVYVRTPPSPEWSGRPLWEQVGGPFPTRHQACEWLKSRQPGQPS